VPETDFIELARGPIGLAFVAVLGLVCGSFVTALSYRLPRGENFVSGRSACPSCKTALTVRDLVPVFSWLIARGRCRYCQAKVSGRYPLIEVTCGILFVVAVMAADPSNGARLFVMWGLVIGLLSLTVTDFEFQRLPNGLVLFVFGLCCALAWLDGRSFSDAGVSIIKPIVTGIALRLFGRIVEKKPGLGWGDIKLLAALSVALSIETVPYFLIVTAAVSLALAAWYVLRRAQTQIPFGPALCAGAVAAFL
jgi:leader peptidase (prepilin peptidase)/N-methyltransferase